ncbi:Rhodanese-like protein [Epithele typhae]|uniref:Rhodanese-like protein n=1 Tax=Epithele typhae TaxID=378194 RepID=UPI002008C6E1|nr:Rhodanese-like protein [Epithele typhae]KAH9913815.1 Rhodanese-like protein [Epithele typhae]
MSYEQDQRPLSGTYTSRSTSTYGQVIPRRSSFEHALIPSYHSQSRSRSATTSRSPMRDQAAQTIVIRALRNAEVVDGTKCGVIFTLPHHAGEQFLKTIASHMRRAMLFHAPPPGTVRAYPRAHSLAPLLVCSSSAELADRCGTLLHAKLLSRVARADARHGRWGALIRDLGALAPDSPIAGGGDDEAALRDAVRKAARAPLEPFMAPPGSRSIARVLADARARLQRLPPADALAELQQSVPLYPVVLVDIRPEAQRAKEGWIEGALAIERNVLEWRFDPRCAARLTIADRFDLKVIVMCQEGFTSSLAAAALHDIGLLNATDIIGGYAAWRAAGLPEVVETSSTAPPTEVGVSVPIEHEGGGIE